MVSVLERGLAEISPAMAERWRMWESDPASLEKSAQECVEALLAAARDAKAHAKLGRMLARQALPQVGLADIRAGVARGLPAPLLRTLANLSWVEHGHALVVTGPSGAGKSYLAIALMRELLLMGKRAELLRVPDWLDEMELLDKAHQLRALRRLSRLHLVVLDDLLVEAMTPAQGHLVRRLVDFRHGLGKATMVTSPVPVAEWDGRFGDDNAGEAICRRLLVGAKPIALKAPKVS